MAVRAVQDAVAVFGVVDLAILVALFGLLFWDNAVEGVFSWNTTGRDPAISTGAVVFVGRADVAGDGVRLVRESNAGVRLSDHTSISSLKHIILFTNLTDEFCRIGIGLNHASSVWMIILTVLKRAIIR